MSLFFGLLRGSKVNPCVQAERAFDQVCGMVTHYMPHRLSEVESALYTENLCLLTTEKGRILSAAIVEDREDLCFVPFLFSSPWHSTPSQESALERLLFWVLKRYVFLKCEVRLADHEGLQLQKPLLEKLGFKFSGISQNRYADEHWIRDSLHSLDSPLHPVNRGVIEYYA